MHGSEWQSKIIVIKDGANGGYSFDSQYMGTYEYLRVLCRVCAIKLHG